MSSVTVHVGGLAELEKKLLNLPDKVNRRVLAKAVSDGAAVIRDEMRVRAPQYTGEVSQGHPPPGTLKKAVFMSHSHTSHLGYEAFVVGVRHGKTRQHVGKAGKNLDAYYFRFVEFGTKFMTPRPFMRPAFDVKKEAALVAITTSLAEGISQAAKE